MPDVCTDHATQRPDALKRENLFSSHLLQAECIGLEWLGNCLFPLAGPRKKKNGRSERELGSPPMWRWDTHWGSFRAERDGTTTLCTS